MSEQEFRTFFHSKTKANPFQYQIDLAIAPIATRAISAPTGAGKTAAAILAWLWRRECRLPDAPTRLIYALPMRTLVEQIYGEARKWAGNIVYKLVGGEVEEEWSLAPNDPAILICTMDMALSRMLNRGYGMSRYRWPLEFGLLNSNSLLVCDEVQLMGNGLATSAQLEAFRSKFGSFGPSATWWMSATLDQSWLRTVDYTVQVPITCATPEHGELQKRHSAAKHVETIAELTEKEIAKRALDAHRPSTLTLVVVNTVARAQTTFAELQKALGKWKGERPEIILAHSRFRELEKREIGERIAAEPGAGGRIVIATQVVEAGVDISARTMITELAPWPSLVQRFGRVNRRGEQDGATIIVTDLAEKHAPPYTPEDLADARTRLEGLNGDASIANLERAGLPPAKPYSHVLRRKDILELFDTAADLSGADLDVSRFIREHDDSDVSIFWREISADGPDEKERGPTGMELCSVPVHEFREKYVEKGHPAYRWDWIAKRWRELHKADPIAPGACYLLPARAGGYCETTGWTPGSETRVTPVPEQGDTPESDRDDPRSQGYWLRIADHTDDVMAAVESLAASLALDPETVEGLRIAARWHDRGKAHAVFQAAVGDELHPENDWAKGCGTGRYEWPGFRHELASALAVIASRQIPERWKDLAAYLVAAHHGKVRTTIRSLPYERYSSQHPVARGVRDGEQLMATDLGGGVIAEQITLNLDPMSLGDGGTGPSWRHRVEGLLRDYGPFRLAYLEAVLRIADWQASRDEEARAKAVQTEAQEAPACPR